MSQNCESVLVSKTPATNEVTNMKETEIRSVPNRNVLLLLIYVGFGGCLGAVLSIPSSSLRKKLGEEFYGKERLARFDTTLEIIQAAIGTASSLLLSRWIDDPRRRLLVAQIGLTCSNVWTAFQYCVWRPSSDWQAYLPDAVWSCFGSVFLADTSVHEISRALHGGEAEGVYVTQTWMKAVKLVAVAGTQTILSFAPDDWHPQTTAAAASCSTILLIAMTAVAFKNSSVFTRNQNRQVTSSQKTPTEEALLRESTTETSIWRQILACALAIIAVGLFTGQRGEAKFMYYMNRDVLKFTDGQVRLILGIQYLAFSITLCISAYLQKKWSNTTRILLVSGIIVSIISRVLNGVIYHGDTDVSSMKILAYLAVAGSSFGPVPEPILRTDALCGWQILSLIKYSSLAMILVDRGGSLVLNPIYYALTVHCRMNPFLLTVCLLALAYVCNCVSRRIVREPPPSDVPS